MADKPLLTHSPNTMTSLRLAAASLAAGASLLSLTAPAVRADVYDSFGNLGGCDSGSLAIHDGAAGVHGRLRDCSEHRDWAGKEAARNRQHGTQTQLLKLGGNLLTGLIFNRQNQQKPQPKTASVSLKAELALMKQQQQIELLKLQLQQQQAMQSGYANQGGQPYTLMQRQQIQQPALHPAYSQPSAGMAPAAQAPATYAPAPYAF